MQKYICYIEKCITENGKVENEENKKAGQDDNHYPYRREKLY